MFGGLLIALLDNGPLQRELRHVIRGDWGGRDACGADQKVAVGPQLAPGVLSSLKRQRSGHRIAHRLCALKST